MISPSGTGAVAEPYWADEDVRLYLGDCLEVLAAMEADSVDAIVTDPPYGLEFMGKEWDRPWKGRGDKPASAGMARGGFASANGYANRETPSYGRGWRNLRCRLCGHITSGGSPCTCPQPDLVSEGPGAVTAMRAYQEWCETWAAECFRVLKPGGWLLAFGGTRTWHRLTCAVEDAGFEIRDCTADLTGIDGPGLLWLYGSGFPKSLDVSKAIDKAAGAEREVIGKSATKSGIADGNAGPQRREIDHAWAAGRSVAAHYDITAPATEDAARWEGWGTALKPSWEPIVVARKPLAGTVAQNVLQHGTGALNVGGCRVGDDTSRADRYHGKAAHGEADGYRLGSRPEPWSATAGRWPPNVVLGAAAAAELDRQSGVLTSGKLLPHHADNGKAAGTLGAFAGASGRESYGDTGGASRFFPVFRYEAKAAASERPRLEDGTAHPTVKPVDLMAWLVRLVTPPSVTVLTCVECRYEQSGSVPGVRQDVSAKAGEASAVLASVSPEGGREGAEAPAHAVPDLREGPRGWPGAEVLQHRVPGDSAAQAQGVHHLPEGVPGASAYAEDVLGEVHGARHEAAAEAVRGMRDGVPAGLEQGALLFPDMLSEGDRASQAQALHDHGQGLPDAVPAGSPDVEPAGLSVGTPQGHGRPSGPDADGRRSSTSPQRGQGRQPAGEPGGSAEAGSRPDPEATTEADRLSALRREDRRFGTCAHCGGALAQSERPGLVLDPFAGSGTTAEACIVEGFRCVLIEQDPKSAELIKTRLHKPIQPVLFGEAS